MQGKVRPQISLVNVVEGTGQLTRAHHLVKWWLSAKLNVANLVFEYILHNHELTIFIHRHIYSHIIAHAFHHYLPSHHLSYVHPNQTV